MALKRGVLLVGIGLASEAVYLTVTLRLPWWRYGGTLSSWSQLLGTDPSAFAACLVGIVLLMAAYLGGWSLLRRGEGHRSERWIVWSFACLFAVTLLFLMPATSDLFLYVSQAHVLTDQGGNPLLHPVLDPTWPDAANAPDADSLVLAYPALYASYPSVYGPAWLLISAPGTLGTFDVAGGLFYLKALMAVAYLACVWLLERILCQIQRPSALESLYLFAWNPLVLLMAVGDGHNDMVMMALVMLSFWLLLRGAWILAFGTLAFSVWIKYVSVVFFPLLGLYVWRHSRRVEGRSRWVLLMLGGAAGLLVSVGVLVPFEPLEWVGRIVARLLMPVNWHDDAMGLAAWTMAAGLLLFAMAYAVLARQLAQSPGRLEQLMDISFVVALSAFVFGAARSQPWHLIWPAALAGLSVRRWAWPAVIALSAIMLVGQIWVEWGTLGLGGNT